MSKGKDNGKILLGALALLILLPALFYFGWYEHIVTLYVGGGSDTLYHYGLFGSSNMNPVHGGGNCTAWITGGTRGSNAFFHDISVAVGNTGNTQVATTPYVVASSQADAYPITVNGCELKVWYTQG